MLNLYHQSVKKLSCFNGLPLLLLRIYLAPIFIYAGYGKLQLGSDSAIGVSKLLADPSVVSWFGNPDWG